MCCMGLCSMLHMVTDAVCFNKEQGETPMAVPGDLRGCADSGRASQLALQGVGRDLEAQESGRALRRAEGRPGRDGQDNQRNQGSRSMKTNAAQEVKSDLDRCEAIAASLVKEAKLLVDSTAEQNSLQR